MFGRSICLRIESLHWPALNCAPPAIITVSIFSWPRRPWILAISMLLPLLVGKPPSYAAERSEVLPSNGNQSSGTCKGHSTTEIADNVCTNKRTSEENLFGEEFGSSVMTFRWDDLSQRYAPASPPVRTKSSEVEVALAKHLRCLDGQKSAMVWHQDML